MSNKHKHKSQPASDTQDNAQGAELPTAENPAEEALQATQESLDTVRDILFGPQLRDHDQRFASIEAKLGADLAAFREEVRHSLTSLQGFVQTELRVLADRLSAEAATRSESLQSLRIESQNANRSLAEQLQSTAQNIEKRIASVDQQQAAGDSEIRNQLAEQAKTLHTELKASKAELQMTIESAVSELTTAKPDRATLATLFTDMAAKLQG